MSRVKVIRVGWVAKGGGTGAVSSVNGQTGAVVLDAADVGAASESTVHFVGDLHVGQSGVAARTPTFAADAVRLNPAIAHRVYVGDIVTTPGDTTMLADATTLLTSIDSNPARRDLIGGNHDYNQFTSSETGSAFMARWGYSGRNWVRDLPAVRLIGITSDLIGASGNWMTITSADLAWLADRLAETTLPCAIVYHAPLYNTVTQGPFPSTNINFYAHPDADIRAVLDAAPTAVAWISGHTHTNVTDPDILTIEDVGSRSIVALNCSAIAYVESLGSGSPIQSPVVTFGPSGLAVRWRDHSAGSWMTVNGEVVTTVSYLELV